MRETRMRAALTIAIFLLGLSSVGEAKDCTVSAEFRLKQAQVFAGILKDPNDAVLSGIELDLLSGSRVVQHVRTTNEGSYDFGRVAAGKYRIHIKRADDPFCAPVVECGSKKCEIHPKLKLNPRKTIVVH